MLEEDGVMKFSWGDRKKMRLLLYNFRWKSPLTVKKVIQTVVTMYTGHNQGHAIYSQPAPKQFALICDYVTCIYHHEI